MDYVKYACEVLDRHRDDVAVLDGIHQWTQYWNQPWHEYVKRMFTSIRSNLTARYGTTEGERAAQCVEHEYDQWSTDVESLGDLRDVGFPAAITNVRYSQVIASIRQRLETASPDLKKVLNLLRLVHKNSDVQDYILLRFLGDEEPILEAWADTISITSSREELIDEMVQAGAINRLSHYRGARDTRTAYDWGIRESFDLPGLSEWSPSVHDLHKTLEFMTKEQLDQLRTVASSIYSGIPGLKEVYRDDPLAVFSVPRVLGNVAFRRHCNHRLPRVLAVNPWFIEEVKTYPDKPTSERPQSPLPGETIIIPLNAPSPIQFRYLPISPQKRYFFPGMGIEFVFDTHIGSIVTHVEKKKKGKAASGGRRIAKNLRPWFESVSLTVGSRIGITCTGDRRYRLEVVDSSGNPVKQR